VTDDLLAPLTPAGERLPRAWEDVPAADLEVLRRRAESLATEEYEEDVDDIVQLLLFALGDEWYAVDVAHVREIYSEYQVTRVPCVPPFIRGIINIRGEIISITDPRRLLGLADAADIRDLPVIVAIAGEIGTALLVDEIGDIVEVPTEDIAPPLAVLDKAAAEYIAGSIYVEERVIAVLNLEKVVTPVGATA
jgi:purine-binding chemotaxis protein CheW